MSRKQTDRCVFCNWTRRSSWPSIRFFNIPKEPGLKKVRWLQSFGDRKISHRDRVCSVHFRSGRPTNDPSHEDFVPHLYLNSEPPPDVLRFLESSVDNNSDHAKILAADASVDLVGDSSHNNSVGESNKLLPLLPKKNHASRPSILRKRKAPINNNVKAENNSAVDENKKSVTPVDINTKTEPVDPQDYEADLPGPSKKMTAFGKNVKIVPINRYLIDVAGLQVGQNVIIRRKIKKEPSESRITHNVTSETENQISMYNIPSEQEDNYGEMRVDDLMNPPLLQHIGMADLADLNEEVRMIDSRIYQHHRNDQQYMIQHQLYQDEYVEDEDVYDILYDTGIDPAVMTSVQR